MNLATRRSGRNQGKLRHSAMSVSPDSLMTLMRADVWDT
jgi:hypothetical protein